MGHLLYDSTAASLVACGSSGSRAMVQFNLCLNIKDL